MKKELIDSAIETMVFIDTYGPCDDEDIADSYDVYTETIFEDPFLDFDDIVPPVKNTSESFARITAGK